MASIRRLVIDVLKPHDPQIVDFSEELAAMDSVEGVTASLIELDKEVQNVKLTFEGEDLDFGAIEDRIGSLSGTIHSVDEVSCGEYIVSDRPTLQDT
jgi:hypothetical protein